MSVRIFLDSGKRRKAARLFDHAAEEIAGKNEGHGNRRGWLAVP
jgi:hypothetical protein